MSYILEALQKSENSRPDTNVPTLADAVTDQNVVTEDNRAGNRLPVTFLIGGLVVVFAGVAWWLTTGNEVPVQTAELELTANNTNSIAASDIWPVQEIESSEQAPISPGNVYEAVGESSPEIASTDHPVAVPDVKKGAHNDSGFHEKIIFDSSPGNTGEILSGGVNTPVGGKPSSSALVFETAPIDDASVSEGYLSMQSEYEQANSRQSTTLVDSVRTDVVDGVSVTTPGAQGGRAQNIVDPEVSGEIEDPVGNVTGDAFEESSGTNQQVQHFRELPYDVQRELPSISYSVHLYSQLRENRMVKIDGMMRREGDTVSPGLVLQEITAEGAIFTFRGHEFRVPVHG